MPLSPRVSWSVIKFFIPPNQMRGGIQPYLERIARIIDWKGELLTKSSGYRYMIGTSNDWWMDIDESNGSGYGVEMTVAYRYGDVEYMTALRLVLMKLLNIEYYNREVDAKISAESES